MPSGPTHRAQTSKQAKAAFKLRGATFISDAERRRLARGAELLERADRAKAQEARRKEWLKKKAEDEAASKGQVGDAAALGSQRRLDRFGYASSQYHLGKFFGAPAAKAVPVGDYTGATSVGNAPSKPQLEPTAGKLNEAPRPGSPTYEACFSGDSSQMFAELEEGHVKALPVELARHNASDPTRQIPHQAPDHDAGDDAAPAPRTADKLASLPSFSSDDGLFDAETMEQLDRGAAEAIAARQRRQQDEARLMPPPPPPPPAVTLQRRAEQRAPPPPPPPPLWQVHAAQKRTPAPLPRPTVSRSSTAIPWHGVTTAELEALAEADFVPTQVPAR